MSRAVLERAGTVIIASLLLQSLWGCAAAQDVTQGPWTRAAPMPTARSELAAAALDGQIYVAGGIAQWGTTAAAFEAYDPATDRWEELPLPKAVHHLAAAARNERIYITGGYTNLLFSEITDRAWAYDPRAQRWARIADLPAPRAAHGMAAIEGKLYVVGGVGPESEDLWIYDPATERWDVARAALRTQREHLAVTVLDGKLHAIGGRWGTEAILQPSRSMTRPQARGPMARICRPRGAGLRPACLTDTCTSRAASHSRWAARSASMRRMTRRHPDGPRSPVCPRRAMAWRRPWWAGDGT